MPRSFGREFRAMAGFFAAFTCRHMHRVGALCAVIVCLGCEGQTVQGAQGAQIAAAPIPNFAPDPFTNWRFQRVDGDDYLPPKGGGPGPVVSPPDRPYRPNDTNGLQDAASNPNYRV